MANLKLPKKPVPRSKPTARITYLKVENFRALRKIEFKDITPLTVLLGPKGSGKSTIFDVFAFLSECFEMGLRRAWDRRGRAKELKSRGGEGPIVIEIKYKEPGYPLITYHLAVDERAGVPIFAEEWLQWRSKNYGQPFRFLDYREGRGRAASGDKPDEEDVRIDIPLKSADLIAVNALGQFAQHPRVAALRDFITGWYVSYFSVDNTRDQPEAGPQERLSRTGDNLANVIQYLDEQYPERLEEIFRACAPHAPNPVLHHYVGHDHPWQGVGNYGAYLCGRSQTAAFQGRSCLDGQICLNRSGKLVRLDFHRTCSLRFVADELDTPLC